MNILSLALFAGLIIALVSLVGAITTIGFFREFLKKHLPLLVSFSAGVFLVVAFGLLSEALHESENAYTVFALAAAGFIGTSLIFRIVPEAHHHHHEEHSHEPHSRKSARKILFADALHNVGDGIVLGGAFLASIPFGIVATVSIAIHEFIQEISEFFVLRQAGYSMSRALYANFIVSLSIFVGIGISMFFSGSEIVEITIIALAAGAFLHIVFEDLFPHSIRSIENRESAVAHLLIASLGALMMLLLIFTGAGH